MNFFKSILSADPEPSVESDPQEEESDQEQGEEDQHADEEASRIASSPFSVVRGGGKTWASFGGLIKTIATRSESVIQTYRRDLEEFSTGLKKETAVFKEVASRAVLDLPGSLEVGASVAQESLETVGQAIDNFGGSILRGTAEIISQGKEALLAADADSNLTDPYSSESSSQIPGSSGRRYSRFESLVLAIQNNGNTFVEEPEDCEDFKRWKLGFQLEEKEEEIENLLYDNGILEGFYEKFVPGVVDRETFWSRYFYRVYRLKQAEDARAKLVKRAISGEEEEELSWEVDDDDDDDDNARDNKEEARETNIDKEEVKAIDNAIADTSKVKPIEEVKEGVSGQSPKPAEEEAKEKVMEHPQKPAEEELSKEAKEISKSVEENESINISKVEILEEAEIVKINKVEDLLSKTEVKGHSEAKNEPAELSKDNDYTVVSSQPSMQEDDDLCWDEIEDLGEHDDKELGASSGSAKQTDLRKRLIVAEDDEDLSWDIEDDED